MRRIVLAIALLPAPALAGGPEAGKAGPAAPLRSPSGLVCQDADLRKVAPDGGPPKPRTLGREPPAEAFYTVLRIENGCDRPMPVRARR